MDVPPLLANSVHGARPRHPSRGDRHVRPDRHPPYLFDLGPVEGRKAVDEVQSGDIAKPAVDEEWITVPGGPTGEVRARIVRPAGTEGTLPVILYIHGAGWVFGNAHTHDRLVRELAVGARAAVVFPEYDLSPEARYPVAIEQNYTVARWVVAEGASKNLDASRIAVAGDSVGGNMTAALTQMAKQRGDVPLVQQVLFYPVTDAAFDTGSYHQLAEGYRTLAQCFTLQGGGVGHPVGSGPQGRSGMAKTALSDNGVVGPTAGRAGSQACGGRVRPTLTGRRWPVKQEPMVVPRSGTDRNLLPSGRRGRQQGIIHDFVMLNALRETHAAEAAINQAVATLRTALGTK